MKKKLKVFWLIFGLLNLNNSIFALQSGGDPTAACGAMGLMLIVWLVIMVVILAVFIGIIIFIVKWIKKDATARNMPNADSIKWLGLLGLFGLVIYLLKRPDGQIPPMNNQYRK